MGVTVGVGRRTAFIEEETGTERGIVRNVFIIACHLGGHNSRPFVLLISIVRFPSVFFP
jgi:hypothetical protein